MRILLVSNWVPPVIAGSAYYAASLSKALAARGHVTQVVTMDWGAGYEPALDPGVAAVTLPIVRLPRLPVFFNLGLVGLSFTPGNIVRFGSIVRGFRPDVIHQVNHIFDSVALTALVAGRLRIPLVGSITTPVQHQNPFAHRIMAMGDALLLGAAGVRHWDAVVCLDEVVLRYVRKTYGHLVAARAAVVPFGVREDRMSDYLAGSIDEPRAPRILMVGHIHPYRDPTAFIVAMADVVREMPEASLILAGRVQMQGPVNVARRLGLLGTTVRFLGQVEHAETVRLMKTSCAATNWGSGPYPGLGTAGMEAMLCGTPVISDLPANLFGDRVPLRNWESLVLVNSKDPESIARAALRLLRDDDLRRRVGEGGRRYVLEHLRWEQIARRMELLYEGLVGPQPG